MKMDCHQLLSFSSLSIVFVYLPIDLSVYVGSLCIYICVVVLRCQEDVCVCVCALIDATFIPAVIRTAVDNMDKGTRHSTTQHAFKRISRILSSLKCCACVRVSVCCVCLVCMWFVLSVRRQF